MRRSLKWTGYWTSMVFVSWTAVCYALSLPKIVDAATNSTVTTSITTTLLGLNQEFLLSLLIAIVSGLFGGVAAVVAAYYTHLLDMRAATRELVSTRKEQRYRRILGEITERGGEWKKVRRALIELYLIAPPEYCKRIWDYIEWYTANESSLKDVQVNSELANEHYRRLCDLISWMRADLLNKSPEPISIPRRLLE